MAEPDDDTFTSCPSCGIELFEEDFETGCCPECQTDISNLHTIEEEE